MKVFSELPNIVTPTELCTPAKLRTMDQNNRLLKAILSIGRHRLQIVRTDITDLDKTTHNFIRQTRYSLLPHSSFNYLNC